MGISEGRLAELRGLLNADNEHAFYSWPEWRRLRREVLRLDNCECQECKRRGVYSRAVIVHHVRHLPENQEMASESVHQALRNSDNSP